MKDTIEKLKNDRNLLRNNFIEKYKYWAFSEKFCEKTHYFFIFSLHIRSYVYNNVR